MASNITTPASVTGDREENLKIASLVVYGILLVVGTCGNSIVPLRVMTDRTLQNPTFVAIASLAVADLLFITWRIPMEILSILNDNVNYGTAVCKLSYLFFQVSSYSAAYHLVLLSAIRYYSLVHPLKALTNMTVKSVCVICGLLWTFIFMCLSTLLFTSGVVEVNYAGKNFYFCLPDPALGIRSLYIYGWCYSLFSYFIPLVILTVFHVTKARTVAHAARKMRNSRTRQMSAMVVLVLLLFGGLLLPVHVKNVLQFTEVISGRDLLEVDLVFRVLAYSNSCINPIVYVFISRPFRRSLARMFPGMKPAETSHTCGNNSRISNQAIVSTTAI